MIENQQQTQNAYRYSLSETEGGTYLTDGDINQAIHELEMMFVREVVTIKQIGGGGDVLHCTNAVSQ